MIGSLWENIPPKGYGGTERVISALTEGLVAKGHDVTLFAAATAKTSAKLISTHNKSLIEEGYAWTKIHYPLLHITEAFDRERDFDILHMHLNKSSDYLALPLAERIKHKVVFTLHFPYPLYHSPSEQRKDRHKVFQKYKTLNYISISHAARKGGEDLNWIANVYNGINLKEYTFCSKPLDYFLWIGKFNPDKGTKEAILAAKKANVKLMLAGKIDTLDAKDAAYYHQEIKPLIDGQQIRYVGEVTAQEKNKLYGGAIAFLNPIQWNEPFGLVMVESQATGTPVISFDNGAASELIDDDKTGYLVKNTSEMVDAIKNIHQIDRHACRKRIEENFTNAQMIQRYENTYMTLLR